MNAALFAAKYRPYVEAKITKMAHEIDAGQVPDFMIDERLKGFLRLELIHAGWTEVAPDPNGTRQRAAAESWRHLRFLLRLVRRKAREQDGMAQAGATGGNQGTDQ